MVAVLALDGAARGQGAGEDFVTGSGTAFNLDFPISLDYEVQARSGPNGENPAGNLHEESFIRGETIVIDGTVTCLAVNGNIATANFRSDTGVIFTRTYVDGISPGDPTDDGFISGANLRGPSDCSPLGFPESNLFFWGASNIVVHDAIDDTTPPDLTVPSNITRNAQSLAGTRVTYTATATDNVDSSPEVSCSPPSGSTFRIGKTTVICTATDDTGNKATKSFNVTVRLPPTKDECKNGGWRGFGTVFRNQGDCVSYVATGGKNPTGGH
jgi:HYR domain-containing protein